MMARAHGVPFYVAAPLSTIDLDTSAGDPIPIESTRCAREITHLGDPVPLTPVGASVLDFPFRCDLRPSGHGHHRKVASPALRMREAPALSSTRWPLVNVPGSRRRAMRLRRLSSGRPAIGAALADRSNVIASQMDIHREWGGVVLELASTAHVRDICGVAERGSPMLVSPGPTSTPSR